MLELLRLFPRRPLAVSIAAWLFLFVMQIAFLSIAAWDKYIPPPESTYMDRVWFVYTELPKAIPMATVYAVCMVFGVQVVGSFLSRQNSDNLTIGQWRELLRTSPVKAIAWISLRVIPVLALLVGLVIPGPSWLRFLLGVLVGLLLGHLMVGSWLKWFVQGMTSHNEEKERRRHPRRGVRNDRAEAGP